MIPNLLRKSKVRLGAQGGEEVTKARFWNGREMGASSTVRLRFQEEAICIRTSDVF